MLYEYALSSVAEVVPLLVKAGASFTLSEESAAVKVIVSVVPWSSSNTMSTDSVVPTSASTSV